MHKKIYEYTNLHDELSVLAYPVLQGTMEADHWCLTMQYDRGIPIATCIQYLKIEHEIEVSESIMCDHHNKKKLTPSEADGGYNTKEVQP